MTVVHPLPWMAMTGMILFLVLSEVFSEPVGVAGAIVGALVVGPLVARQWVQEPIEAM